ncbi:GNAT family N-acetyltransferase [Phaeovulum sp.]|uniref:GNAT family N-acetyltransferase n=1 Tax=Phaeovulum sp. TaxID=2934796 RepID=UPI0039E6301E
MTDPIFEVIDATWPAAAFRNAGAFVLREGKGGGKRVSAASAGDDWAQSDIDLAEAAHRTLGQNALFMVRPGEQGLDTALAQRGYRVIDPVTVLSAPIDILITETPPPITTFCVWPPLQIIRDIWAEDGIGPSRLAVMDRVAGPKCAVLGRTEDRAAGAGFVALHHRTAMLHALCVLPQLRRRGLAGWMLRQSALWAKAKGAHSYALAVTRANTSAIALYESLGMIESARYHYRIKADITADGPHE